MKKKIFIFLSFFLVISFISVFAQSSNANILTVSNNQSVYEMIDAAFRDKNSDSVSSILASCRLEKNYYQYEEYVLQKTRALLLSNQLDLIQSMCMAIIDNNLDNTDALNLYVTVEKSVAKRNARQKIIQEQRNAEAAYVAQATEREKESIRKDYNTIENTTTGQTVFVSPVTSKYYSDFTWSLAFNIAELCYRYAGESFSANFGVGLSGDLIYRGANTSIGAEIFVDTSVLNFSAEDNSISELTFVPMIAFTKLNEDLFFRAGFSQMQTVTLNNSEAFSTPVIGLGLKNIKKGDITFAGYVDYYLGHIFQDDMKAAFGAGIQSTFKIGHVGNANLSLFTNLKESLFVLTDGIDSRTRITIGLGVECNE